MSLDRAFLTKSDDRVFRPSDPTCGNQSYPGQSYEVYDKYMVRNNRGTHARVKYMYIPLNSFLHCEAVV